MCQNSEYGKVLNIAGFSICYSVTQRSGYARICLDRVLNLGMIQKIFRAAVVRRSAITTGDLYRARNNPE